MVVKMDDIPNKLQNMIDDYCKLTEGSTGETASYYGGVIVGLEKALIEVRKAIEEQKRKCAEWITIGCGWEDKYRCSHCGCLSNDSGMFCPHCGYYMWKSDVNG